MSISLSIGRWGGFYLHRGYTVRLCLGWVAFTWYPFDLDDYFQKTMDVKERLIRELVRLEDDHF